MLEERNGKKINKIQFSKKHISIYFDDDSILKISESTFSHFYLYVDKVVFIDEYKQIEDYQNLHSAREYAINLLSKGLYTEKEIYNRLVNKKKLKEKDVKTIIEYLIEHNFINDKNYFMEYVEMLHNKNYGKNKIIQKCYEKGFSKENIDSLKFDEDFEKEKAASQVNKYLIGKSKNYQKLKEGCYTFLLNQGFDFDICSNVIKIIDDVYDFSNEKELLKKEIIKYLHSHKVKLIDYDEKQKLISTFTRRGYSYDDVKNVIKGVSENEIC